MNDLLLREQLLVGLAKLWLSKTSLTNVYRIPGPPSIVSAEITTTKGATTDGFAVTFRLGPTYRLNKRFDLLLKAGYWLTLAQLSTTGTFSSGRYTINPDYWHLSNPSIITSKDFEAKHQEKNTSTTEVIAGVRFNF